MHIVAKRARVLPARADRVRGQSPTVLYPLLARAQSEQA